MSSIVSPAAATTAAAPPKRSPTSRRHAAIGWGFVFPAFIIACALFVVPLLYAVWISLNNWPLIGAHHFTGASNYTAIPHDKQFVRSVIFTLIYTGVTTVAVFLVGTSLALCVAAKRRGVSLFRTAFFLPYVVGLAAASLEWYVLYNDSFGPFTAILHTLGISNGPVDWLGTPAKATMSVVAMIVWKFVGFQMIVTVVGLQSIDPQIYEAASLAGANRRQMFRYISLPLLRPTLTLLLILSVTGSLLAFDQFYIMTAGGPDNSTITMVFSVTRAAFTDFRLGAANAFAVVILTALVIINIGQLRTLRGGNPS